MTWKARTLVEVKVLTRTLLVLMAVPLVLAIGARFVSPPSAASARTAAITTTVQWNYQGNLDGPPADA